MDDPPQQETGHETPLTYVLGTVAFVAVAAASAFLLDVRAPDQNTTSLLALVVAAIGLVVALDGDGHHLTRPSSGGVVVHVVIGVKTRATKLRVNAS